MKEGWTTKEVGEIAEHSLGKMLDKQKNTGTLKPYLRNVNVRWFSFDLSDLKTMRFEDHELSRFAAVKGDVLVCEGGYPGRSAIWNHDEPIFIQKAIHRLRFHEPERSRWFVHWMHYLHMSGELVQHFTGSGIQHLTRQTLNRLTIPLPPLPEQRRIVAILDEAFAAIAKATENAERRIETLTTLKHSFLHHAFTGNLADKHIHSPSQGDSHE